MQTVSCTADFANVTGNIVIGAPQMRNSKIVFEGEGNLLFCEEGVRLVDTTITFKKSGAVVYLRNSKHPCKLNLTMWNDTVFYLGKDNYINQRINSVVSERCNVLIGDDCLFSFGVWIRTADPHLVYSVETHERKNPSRSVYLGDHVWVGQDAMLLKGSQMGSGSILGAKACLTGKATGSNTSWGGVPAKQIATGLFFCHDSVHGYTEEDTAASQAYEGDEFIYQASSANGFKQIEADLANLAGVQARWAYLKRYVAVDECDKNRFALDDGNAKLTHSCREFSQEELDAWFQECVQESSRLKEAHRVAAQEAAAAKKASISLGRRVIRKLKRTIKR